MNVSKATGFSSIATRKTITSQTSPVQNIIIVVILISALILALPADQGLSSGPLHEVSHRNLAEMAEPCFGKSKIQGLPCNGHLDQGLSSGPLHEVSHRSLAEMAEPCFGNPKSKGCLAMGTSKP